MGAIYLINIHFLILSSPECGYTSYDARSLESTLLLLQGLVLQRLVDVRDHTTARDGCLDQSVELLVTSDGQLQMSGGDSLHLEILGGVSGELQNLGGQVLKDGSSVDGSSGTHSAVRGNSALQESVQTTDGELETSSRGSRHRGLLGLARSSLSALSTLSAERTNLGSLSSLSSRDTGLSSLTTCECWGLHLYENLVCDNKTRNEVRYACMYTHSENHSHGSGEKIPIQLLTERIIC